MTKLLFSLALIVSGVTCGYVFQHLVNRDIIVLRAGLNPLKKRIQQVAFAFLNPVVIIGATWVAKLEDITLFVLPLLCVFSLALGGILAYGISRIFSMGRKQTGAFLGCGVFTNIGAFGALFCYIFLGEAGFALVPIYKICEEFIYFAILFPLAKSYSLEKKADNISLTRRLLAVLSDIYIMISLLSIGLGLLLNLTGVTRPEIYSTFNAIAIPGIVFLLLFTIGLGMRFTNITPHIYPALSISAAKLILIPIVTTSLGFLVGLHTVDNGLPLKVVIILSAMPVGLTSVIPPTLFDLDADLANACWLVCTSLLLIQVPILHYIVSNLTIS